MAHIKIISKDGITAEVLVDGKRIDNVAGYEIRHFAAPPEARELPTVVLHLVGADGLEVDVKGATIETKRVAGT